MSTEIQVAAPQITPMELLQSAVNQGANIDTIERLVKLQRDMLEYDAKVAFAQAFARFKEKVPAIVKESIIPDKQGNKRSMYAKLDKIAENVLPCLLSEGITYRWKTKTDKDGKTSCTCFLRHILGHEEEGSTLEHIPDSSGSMNALQGLGSTVSYLERYTVIASCGIVIKDADNDGSGAPLTDAQLNLVKDIRTAKTVDEVRSIYREAYKTAFNANEPAAGKAYLDAKDARIEELTNANS